MSRLTFNMTAASLAAQRGLAESTAKLDGSLRRLSTGLRINRASDDAAGLAIASALRVDGRVLWQGLRNLNEGVSMLSLMEGALREATSTLQRMQELAQNAANATLGSAQRAALDAEAQALADEFQRLLVTASFNDIHPYRSAPESYAIQTGYGTTGTIEIALGYELSGGAAVNDGTFQLPQQYDAGNGSEEVAFGDFDNDGILDMVTSGDSVDFRSGNGDGTFGSPAQVTLFVAALSIAAADVDGDGNLDIITGGDGLSTSPSRRVYLGDGNGNFDTGIDYSSGSGSAALGGIAAGDLNGDGRADLVTADRDDDTISVLLANSDGTYQPRTTYAAVLGPTHVSLGDLNGDGDLDLMFVGDDDGVLGTRLGDGNGGFGALQTRIIGSRAPTESYSLATGDFNEDGKLDVVVAEDTGPTVYAGNGDGTFQPGQLSGGGQSKGILAVDYDGDGSLDIIAAGIGAGNFLELYKGDGSGGLSYQGDITLLDYTVGVFSEDLDGNGTNDLVTVGTDAYVLLGNGTEGSGSVQLEDFNLLTQAAALQALDLLQETSVRIERELGGVGAALSRFSAALEHQTSLHLQLVDAESKIMDADLAEEVAKLAQSRVLRDASAAILAQANQLPAVALDLLK